MAFFRVFFGVLLVCLATVLFSCDEYCDQGTTTAMVVEFYNADSGRPMELSGYRMVGTGAPIVDSVRLRQYAGFALAPLSNAADTTWFVFGVKSLRPDTLVVVARRQPKVISAECGCVMYATIDTAYLTHPSDTILDVKIIQRQVKVVSYREDAQHEKNLRILF